MSAIELSITPRTADIGGMDVRRVLPFRNRRMVGPFIFLDHMGPAFFAAHQGIDVKPHPHIGLATVTYLFQGDILHRDTLGSEQVISPGDVNWMTAGAGIAHSERTGEAVRAKAHALHGLQSWVALPRECEEKPPAFVHHAAHSLPFEQGRGADIRLIAGRMFGHESPVQIYSPLFYADIRLQAGAYLDLPPDYDERALYLIEGEVSIDGTPVAAPVMPVFEKGGTVRITARTYAHFAVLGGAPLPEKRFIWWNFVSSSQDRIVQAKQDWKDGRFGKIAGDGIDFVPLPEQ